MGKLSRMPSRVPEPAEPLHQHAIEQLRFIRSTMERAGSFTLVPGAGGVLMGLSALAAAWLAHRQVDRQAWLTVWLTEVVVAVALGALAMAHKAKRSNTPLWSEPARKFVLSFFPAVFTAAVLTFPLFQAGQIQALAASWLLLYGTAVIAGGAFSVKIVPAMGVCFLGLGLVALLAPPALIDLPLAAGFGGLHLIFGAWIYRRYGG